MASVPPHRLDLFDRVTWPNWNPLFYEPPNYTLCKPASLNRCPWLWHNRTRNDRVPIIFRWHGLWARLLLHCGRTQLRHAATFINKRPRREFHTLLKLWKEPKIPLLSRCDEIKECPERWKRLFLSLDALNKLFFTEGSSQETGQIY